MRRDAEAEKSEISLYIGTHIPWLRSLLAGITRGVAGCPRKGGRGVFSIITPCGLYGAMMENSPVGGFPPPKKQNDGRQKAQRGRKRRKSCGILKKEWVERYARIFENVRCFLRNFAGNGGKLTINYTKNGKIGGLLPQFWNRPPKQVGGVCT